VSVNGSSDGKNTELTHEKGCRPLDLYSLLRSAPP